MTDEPGLARDWWEYGTVWSARAADRQTVTTLLAGAGGVLADLLAWVAKRRLDPPGSRPPLRERVSYVQDGGEQRIGAVLVGNMDWCPDEANSDRVVHVMARYCWHTSGLVSEEVEIPAGHLTVTRVRRPSFERTGAEAAVAGRSTWGAVDLALDSGWATILGHRSDLAFLALTQGWDFPRADQ